jgi:hypothetical protein
MVRPVEKILQDVLDIMGKFTYTENEDRPSNSFFEAELNEDGFFILRQEIIDYLVSAKNTEQANQHDSGERR